MTVLRSGVSAFSIGLMICATGPGWSQTYPSKYISIMTTPAGGFGDMSARLIGQGISGPLGQPVVVENYQSNLIGGLASKTTPDGYTLVHSGATFIFAPLLRPTPYDVVRDFAPITLAVKSLNVLVTHPSLPVKSVKELIALAKARPGELNYANSAVGGSSHLAAELFKAMAGANIVTINYKGGAAGLNGLMGGEVQLMFADPTAMAHVKTGKLKALGVTSPQASVLIPGVPPVALGLPGYEMVGIDGIWAPAGTPAAIISRLNQEIVRILRTPEAKEKYLSLGGEAYGSSAEEFGAKIKSDIATMSKVIKDAGIKIE